MGRGRDSGEVVTGVLRAGGACTCGWSDPSGCSGEGTAWALVQLQEVVAGKVSWTMYAHGPSVELTGHWPVTSAVVSKATEGSVLGKILPPCCAWGPRTYPAMASHRDPFCPSVHPAEPMPTAPHSAGDLVEGAPVCKVKEVWGQPSFNLWRRFRGHQAPSVSH